MKQDHFVCVHEYMHKTHKTLRMCTKTTLIITFLTLFTKVHKKTRFWNEISLFRVCATRKAQNIPNTLFMHKNHINLMFLTLFAKVHQKTSFWTEIWPLFCLCARLHAQNVSKRVKTHCSELTHKSLSLCTKKHANRMFLTLFTNVHRKTQFRTEIWPFRVCVQRERHKTSQTHCLCTKTM